MNTNEQSPNSSNFDLKVLIEIISGRKLIIAVIIIISVLVSFLYTKIFCVNRYTACAKLLIVNVKDESESLNSTDFYVSSHLINDYSEIIVDRVVLNKVISDLSLKKSYSALKSSVSIDNPNNSRILEIYVTAASAQDAQKIANKICTVSKEEIKNIIGIDSVNVMSPAALPSSPSSPNMRKNMLVGLAVGVLLAAATVTVLYYLDDKIKGESDVTKYLGIGILGNIPYTEQKAKETRGRSRA